MGIPYIGFGNDTLSKLPTIEAGVEVQCNGCPGMHPLRCGTDEQGEPSKLLMFYACPVTGNSYIGAVAGRLVTFRKPDVTGSL